MNRWEISALAAALAASFYILAKIGPFLAMIGGDNWQP